MRKRLAEKFRDITLNQSAARLISASVSIVLLLALVFVIIARSVAGTYRIREKEQRTDTAVNMANSFDKLIDSASDLVLMFYAHDGIRQVDILRSGNMQKCEELLSSYVSNYPVIDNAILITGYDGELKSACSRRDMNISVYFECVTSDYDEYMEMFEKSADTYILSPLYKPDSSSMLRALEGFTYVQRIVSTRDGSPIGLMFINFNRTSLRTMLGVSGLKSDENLLVINRSAEQVFSVNDNITAENIGFSSVVYGFNGDKYRTDDGEKLEMYCGGVTDRPYRVLLYGKESDNLLAQFGSGVAPAVVITVICVFLLLYLAWILFFQNRTIRNVKEILEKPDNLKLNKILINDSSSIEGIVSRQLVYANQLKQQNDDQQTVMRKKLLNDLLTARTPLDTDFETRQLERFGIPVTNQSFIVANFETADISDGENEPLSEQEPALLQFVAENIFRDYGDCVAIRIDGRIVCLFSTDSELNEQDVKAVAEKITDVCKTEFNHTVFSGIGSVSRGLTSISRSYYRACAALDFAVSGKETVCLFKDITGSGKKQSAYARIIESKFHFLNLVKAKDYDSAKKAIDWIFDAKARGNEISAEFLALQCYELLRTLGEYVSGDSSGRVTDAMSDRIECIMYCRDTDALRRRFYDVLDQFVRLLKETDGTGNFTDEVARIVEEEYANPDLSVSFIAERMNQNPRTLSARFIKKTGSGLLDYIHKVRIEKAKNMLTVEGKSVQEVTFLTGYESPNTFIRIFKRYSGITPGRYKEIYTEGGKDK